MDYNPFVAEYNKLSDAFIDAGAKKRKISEELRWYDSTNIDSLYSKIEGNRLEKRKYDTLMHIAEAGIKETQIAAENKESKVKTLFNPLNWFDKEQAIFRGELAEINAKLAVEIQHRSTIISSLAELERDSESTQSLILKFNQFDRFKISAELESTSHYLESLKTRLLPIEKQMKKVDAALRPILDQLAMCEASVAHEKRAISDAKSLERDLEYAVNPYDRKLVHERCERIFGDGRPKTIISSKENTVRKLERDIDKLKQRAKQLVARASRDIRKIVIDGNNLCYENSRFIGLEPLIAITRFLSADLDVTVIFDAGIRGLLKSGDDEIRENFNESVKVHVVATRTQADETILAFSADDEHCFVISNDRFIDFIEKDTVKNNRLIRHEILSGRVIIHDLDLNLNY